MPKRPLSVTSTTSTSNTNKKPKMFNKFLSLEASIKDPSLQVQSDSLVHVIKDKYPKATFHYLIIPKEPLKNIQSLTGQNISLIEYMEKIGNKLTSNDSHQGFNFKMGFHAQPSMTPLHLHVISDDMTSDCLKTKKHWNSFTTDFFITSQDLLENLRKNDKVILPTSQELKTLLDSKLKCHKCSFTPKNMPHLKSHILTHNNKEK